jgi:chaperonin GroEL (HSP60 family)
LALENAASIASLLLTTECVIGTKKDEKDSTPQMPPQMGF